MHEIHRFGCGCVGQKQWTQDLRERYDWDVLSLNDTHRSHCSDLEASMKYNVTLVCASLLWKEA
jgi:hypothetical protein